MLTENSENGKGAESLQNEFAHSLELQDHKRIDFGLVVVRCVLVV